MLRAQGVGSLCGRCGLLAGQAFGMLCAAATAALLLLPLLVLPSTTTAAVLGDVGFFQWPMMRFKNSGGTVSNDNLPTVEICILLGICNSGAPSGKTNLQTSQM